MFDIRVFSINKLFITMRHDPITPITITGYTTQSESVKTGTSVNMSANALTHIAIIKPAIKADLVIMFLFLS